jgi:hypothetical protein
MMIWGKYTWIFFHTLAEKIKDDSFHEYKHIITGIIHDICSCLPCPICKEHAMETLKVKNIHNVQSKNELIMFIYHFHNTVTNKKKLKMFDNSVLNQYKHANLFQIIRAFNQYFTTNIPGLMTEQLKRRMKVNRCMETIKQHWHIFDK